MMKSSLSSCAWMYPLTANVWSIQSSISISPPESLLDSTAASNSLADAPVDSKSLIIRSTTEADSTFFGGFTTGSLGLILGLMEILDPFSSLDSTVSAMGDLNSSSHSQQTNT